MGNMGNIGNIGNIGIIGNMGNTGVMKYQVHPDVETANRSFPFPDFLFPLL